MTNRYAPHESKTSPENYSQATQICKCMLGQHCIGASHQQNYRRSTTTLTSSLMLSFRLFVCCPPCVSIIYRLFSTNRTTSPLIGGPMAFYCMKCLWDSHLSMAKMKRSYSLPSPITMYPIQRVWAKKRRTYAKGYVCWPCTHVIYARLCVWN